MSEDDPFRRSTDLPGWSVVMRMTEGSEAYDNGKPITANPYKKGDSSLRNAWDDGWKLAAQEDESNGPN